MSEIGWPVLVQLRGEELQLALPHLRRGALGLEIGAFASPRLLDGDWRPHLRELQSVVQDLPGPLTMHGPFLDMSPASPEPRLRELTAERYRLALQIAGELGARHLVLHTQWNPNLRQPDYPQLWREGNLRFFEALLPAIEASGTTILFENMWDPGPDQLLSLLEQLPAGHFAACLDTGHAHLFSQLTWQGWVRALGERLAYLHISDNHGGWDQHLPAGAGGIDYPALFAALNQQQLRPWVVLEVPRWADVQSSLRHLGWCHLLSEPSDGRGVRW